MLKFAFWFPGALLSVVFLASWVEVYAEPTVAPSATKAPRHTLKITAICSIGFEDAIHDDSSIGFDNPRDEEWCNKRSLCGFQIAAGIPCDELLPGEGYDSDMVARYDLDKNGEVDCADYLAWKHWLAEQFRRGNRKVAGETLFIAECDHAHNNRTTRTRGPSEN